MFFSFFLFQPPTSDEPPKKQAKETSSGLWDSFDAEVKKQGSSTKVQDCSDMDLRNYFSLPCEGRETDPLKWWAREGKSLFPRLYLLATKYLSIPATSVPSERVFSTAGDIISRKRNRIGEEGARMLICLHKNLT